LKRLVIFAIVIASLVSAGWYFDFIDRGIDFVEGRQAEYVLSTEDETAFRQWLKEEPSRETLFTEFSDYLREQGVDKVVPVWTLTRGDVNRLPWCADAGFVLPPKRLWPNIVPTLRLIRDHVIPIIGRVEVRSGFRTPALNSCAHGAPKSRHLSYFALDMVALNQPDGRTVFSKLCAQWKKAGPQSRWGLGAYFDPNRSTVNKDARFHVDATGWRTWGFSKKAGSSGCLLLK
jgi:hypothetical protein